MGVGDQAWAQLLELAEHQHGALSSKQLRSGGISAKAERAARGRGRLRPLFAGVVAVTGAEPTWRQLLHGGLLALGDDAWVSHEAAAALHGLDRHVPDALEFCVRRSTRRKPLAGATVHTADTVRAFDVVVVDGLRCSSATRTVLELAALGVSADRLAAAIDSAVRLRLTAPAVLAERRGPGLRGVRALDRLLADAGVESMLERRFLALLRRHGLPRPQLQQRIAAGRRLIGRVDFLYPDEGIVVELGGGLGHSTPLDRRRDARRRNELQGQGLVVVEFTWEHVTGDPDYVATTLRRWLRSRSPRSSDPARSGSIR